RPAADVSARVQEPLKRSRRWHPACGRPRRKIRNGHPAVTDFAVVNPALRLSQSIAKVALSQPRITRFAPVVGLFSPVGDIEAGAPGSPNPPVWKRRAP